MPWQKGQSGNPNGRPKKEREERFMEITLSAVSFAEWRIIVKKAVEQAERGNPTARKWLSDFLLGLPMQKHDITSGGESIVLHWPEDVMESAA